MFRKRYMITGVVFVGLGIVSLAVSFLLPHLRLVFLIVAGSLAFMGGVFFLIALIFGPMMDTVEKMPGYKKNPVEQMASGLSRARNILSSQVKKDRLLSVGKDVKVKVLAIKNTGEMVNYNPIFEFELLVEKEKYSTYVVPNHRQVVSRIIVPRIAVGDHFDAKVDPENPEELWVEWIK
ncbi:hypothetical protein JXM67_01915 [candidate division WOR-3 bacterium]|nr:hypothetical protein [candidate division WOR-3 bacterium]